MADKVRHSGIVDQIEGDCVKVRILQTSACASCKVAGHCNASEAKEKVVDVFGAYGDAVRVGDRVTVTASRQVAAHALLLGFGIPFLLLVAVLVVGSLLTADEAVVALTALASLLPYYLVLYLRRGRLREKIAFHLELS